mgnify:CR=1 FL=1
MGHNSNIRSDRGAVSIFIVMFTALLVTIVTASFIQIMLRNQQQASNNDLSQSAYDSAIAGVEDAKRALVKLKQCSRDSSIDPIGCANVSELVGDGQDCEVLGEDHANIVEFNDGEVMVGESAMNQAYTCVKVDVQTESYDGSLDPGAMVVIPLVPVGDPNNLTSVRISWYSQDDLPLNQTTPALPAAIDLPRDNGSSWGATVPPIMRAQLIQFDGNAPISVDGFDSGNARTRLLYPFAAGSGTANFGDDNRRAAGTNSLTTSDCRTSFFYKGFACSVVVSIPGGFSAPQRREAYLQLAGYYIRPGGKMTYSVELLGNAGTSVDFDNVQPKVDSTGRASDLFRRVRASVTVSPSGVPDRFPEATVTTGNLCKDFFITNDPAQYNANATGGATSTCEP